jgi:hypothetical protein
MCRTARGYDLGPFATTDLKRSPSVETAKVFHGVAISWWQRYKKEIYSINRLVTSLVET